MAPDLTCYSAEKKAWVPKHVKKRQQQLEREEKQKRVAAGTGKKPLEAWDDKDEEGEGKEDEDSDVETRKRQTCPETDDDWAALYGGIAPADDVTFE